MATIQLWHFDETTDATSTHEEVSDTDLTLAEGITISNPGTGKFGSTNALGLEGATDLNFPAITGTSDNWTIEFSTHWPVHARNSSTGIMSFNRDGSNELIIQGKPVEVVVGEELVSDPNQYSINIGTQAAFDNEIQFSAAAAAGGWIDWAVVFDGGTDTLSVYQDGTRVYNEASGDYDWSNGWSWESFIFGRGGQSYNYGDPLFIDELRISDTALYTGSTYSVSTEPFTFSGSPPPPPPEESSATVVLLRPASVYQHVQATPATTWTILHHLNYNQGSPVYPIVDAYSFIDGELTKIMPTAVTWVDDTTVTLTFSSSYSGFATLV